MSQHHKKEKDTRQRKNVDKENSNNKNNTTTKTNSAKTSSGTNSTAAGADKIRKTNNGALSTTATLNMKQMKPLSKQQKEKLKAEREALVIWRQPVKTLSYCSLEVVELVKTLARK